MVLLRRGVSLDISDDGIYGHVYLSCQWGMCQRCEVYLPYTPPEGWLYLDDWFCPDHRRSVLLEDGVQWIVGRPWAGEPGGYRRRDLRPGRSWSDFDERVFAR